MSYAQGGLIDNIDYNNLSWGSDNGGTYVTSPANLAVVLGVGTGRYGYGNSTSAYTAVANGATVTAAQWTGLIQGVNTVLAHQGQATITPTSVTTGNLITYYNSITTGVTTAFNNVGNVTSTTDGTATNTQFSGAWGGSGNRRLAFTQTVTFASGDQARYFFNAGGQVKLSFSRSGGTANTRNSEWTDTCTQAGTLVYGYLNTTRSGGGPTAATTLLNSNNGGYWNTSTTPATHYKIFSDTSPYTTDYIQVDVAWSGTAANGGYPVLTFNTFWVNSYSNVNQQTVDGTATTSILLSTPTTTYLGSPWGTPSIGGSVVSN